MSGILERLAGPQQIATILVISCLTATSVSAQDTEPAGRLGAVLAPGATVWITEAGAREEKVQIVDVSNDALTITEGGAPRRVRTADVVRVRVRASDPLWNGAVIGAGVAVASGLSLCLATEPWDNCRDDVGPMLRIGALGAGVGIALDALIRGRETVYDVAPAAFRLEARPLMRRRTAGLQLSVRF